MTQAITNYGYARVNRGWGTTAPGQIRRATSVEDKVLRLLTPLWGPVIGEEYRGNATRPNKQTEAIEMIVTDRIHLVLSPMIQDAEISQLQVTVSRLANNPHRVKAILEFLDEHKEPHRMETFVRVTA